MLVLLLLCNGYAAKNGVYFSLYLMMNDLTLLRFDEGMFSLFIIDLDFPLFIIMALFDYFNFVMLLT